MSKSKKRGVFDAVHQRAEVVSLNASRAVVLGVFAFVSTISALSIFAIFPEVVRSSGEILPSSGYLQVQSSEDGAVAEIYVDEGEFVREGQRLATLRSLSLVEVFEDVGEELRSVRFERENLRRLESWLSRSGNGVILDATGINDENFLFAASQLSIVREEQSARSEVIADLTKTLNMQLASLRLATDRFGSRKAQLDRDALLLERGVISRQEFEAREDALGQLEGAVFDAGMRVSQTQRELTAARSGFREHLLQVRKTLSQDIFRLQQREKSLELKLSALEARLEQLVVRAPVDGTIHHVAYPNLGEMIGAGVTIFDLLPANMDLVAEVELDRIDIGHIDVGEEVKLNVDTYDVRRYGNVTGVVQSISPNLIFDPVTSREFFRVVVKLNSETIGSGPLERDLRAGMGVTAEIVTAERSAFAYFTKPIIRSFERAFGER